MGDSFAELDDLEDRMKDLFGDVSETIDANSIFGRSFSLGKYKLLELLDYGGQAFVFRALDVELERDVVIKLLRKNLSGSEKARVLAEGRAMSGIDSRHVVKCHTVEEHNSIPYMVMEFVKGDTLFDYAQRKRPTPEQSLDLVCQIAEGVRHVHAAGFLHLDLKPSNVMISESGDAKLIDFGLARSVEDVELANWMGSPSFVAPEWSRRQFGEVGPVTDIFGLGGILYYLLTELPPFAGDTKEEVMLASREGTVIPPQRYVPGLSDRLNDLVVKCLVQNPVERFQSVDQLLDAARRTVAQPKRRLRFVGAGLLVALILVAGIGFWFNSLPDNSNPTSTETNKPTSEDAASSEDGTTAPTLASVQAQIAGISEQAFDYELNDNFNQAADLYRQILGIAESSEFEKALNSQVMYAQRDLARNQERLGQYDTLIRTREDLMDSFGRSPSKEASLVWNQLLTDVLKKQAKLPLDIRSRVEKGVTLVACAGNHRFTNEQKIGFMYDAIDAYSNAIDNDIRLGLCHYRLASTYYHAKQFDKSLVEFQRAHQIYTEKMNVDGASTIMARHFVGECHFQQDQFDEAEPIFRESIRLSKPLSNNLGMFHVSLGDLLSKKNQFKDAKTEFESAFQTYDDFSKLSDNIPHEIDNAELEIPRVLNRLANVSLDMNNTSMAQDHLADSVERLEKLKERFAGKNDPRIKRKLDSISEDHEEIRLRLNDLK